MIGKSNLLCTICLKSLKDVLCTIMFLSGSTSQSVKKRKSMSVLLSAEARHILYCGGNWPKYGNITMIDFIG